jgi:predicted transposase/invertase (TIGR01784 family)
VEPALREVRTDFVFTALLRGKQVYIYVLFEHQSERDPWMALRLLGYMTRLWEDQRKELGVLYPIVPIVLYHGDEPWTGAQFSELFDPEAFELVAEHAPDFRFIVDDLGTQDDAALRARALTELAAVTLVLLRDGRKTHDLLEFFGPWIDTFRAVATAPDGFNAMMAVIRYVSRVTQVSRRHVQEFARLIGPQTESANMTAAEEIAQEAEARGIEQGRRGLLLNLVTLKFGPPDADTLRVLERATPEQLSECAERILTATSIDEVLAPCR